MSNSNRGDPPAQSESIRIIKCNRKRADDAFYAYSALYAIEEMRPDLRDNPAWVMLRQDAYENFALAFEEVGQ
jgi:hypothetical protein